MACNWGLMNRIDYSNPKVIKNVLFNYDELMRLARKGDQVAAIVCVDVKQAVHVEKVLTFKQRRYLGLWWQGFNTIEIAAMYHISHVAVINIINRGFVRISNYLGEKGYKTPHKTYYLGEDTLHGL